ncbi:hypothetical protein HanRHA438_Chr01g0024371 [Helianthus annuus]|nr:uncharacterized protein LOC110876353 isoform X1 [Helianthus annuus]XP_021980228.1 uncharacterized protein LOC110876353 isoform X1 [Helianthus annuus]XP_021980232.1 uncharacterized protein LOC110876353 isoform X1 [Helianthus annuus]KAF5822214.1 hypothetical protein HanXRQr2_Chr01g0023871 [Helianthus annuus]KAJ0627082.1 hypothetical protein HanHA89_Chr01g0021271 [Helianthus annuus]KAJ0783396.1 hypothetical protein HanLR1_Chr01g0019881 [Helianthus annuus]KAJ0948188.1 hypothetical protein HanR
MAVLDDSCELCSPSDEIVDVSDKERSPKCLKLDSPEENEFPSPTGLSHSPIIEEPESSASDKTEAVNKQKFAILNTMASTYALRVDPLEPPDPLITMYFSIRLFSLHISYILCVSKKPKCH